MAEHLAFRRPRLLFDYAVHELGYTAAAGLDGARRNDGASREPGPAAPTREGEHPAAPVAGPVLDAAAREDLVRQAAGKSTREVQQMLAEVDPELAQPSDRMRALGGGHWELKATIDAECRHGLEKLLMLLSHRDPHLTLGGLAARLVRDGLDRYDPARPPRSRRTGGRGSADDAGSASTPARSPRRCGESRAALIRRRICRTASDAVRHPRRYGTVAGRRLRRPCGSGRMSDPRRTPPRRGSRRAGSRTSGGVRFGWGCPAAAGRRAPREY